MPVFSVPETLLLSVVNPTSTLVVRVPPRVCVAAEALSLSVDDDTV